MGVVCSHVGAVRVMPDGLGRLGSSQLLNKRRSRQSTKSRLSLRRSAGDGSAMHRIGEVMDIHMDACLIPLAKVSETLDMDVYKRPVIVVTLTVVSVDKTTIHVINNAAIDWGKLVLFNQVPKSLPKIMSPGSYSVYAVLSGSSPMKGNITFRGLINGETVEHCTEVKYDAPYLSNPTVLAETLQVFQSQLQEEVKSLQRGKLRASKGAVSTDTGYRSNVSLKFAEQAMNEEAASDTGAFGKTPIAKRKNTPFVKSLPKSVNVSMLRGMIESMSFREEDEEDEETGDDLSASWHMRRRMSGRMSRLSRRFSVQSVGVESNSSIFVNPPGTRCRSRLSRRSHSSRWNERSSVIEYRQQPGEVSDFETSASDYDRFNSMSSLGGANVSESSYSWSEPRPLEELVALPSWSPLGPGSGDRKQVYSEEKLTPENVIMSRRMRTHDFSSGNITSDEVVNSQRQRRATPRSFKMVRKLSLPLRNPVHMIREEEGLGEETQTDGQQSSHNPTPYRRKISSLRKKRHLRSTLSAKDLLRRMDFYNSLPTSPHIPENPTSTQEQTSLEERHFAMQEQEEEQEVITYKKEEMTPKEQQKEMTRKEADENEVTRKKEVHTHQHQEAMVKHEEEVEEQEGEEQEEEEEEDPQKDNERSQKEEEEAHTKKEEETHKEAGVVMHKEKKQTHKEGEKSHKEKELLTRKEEWSRNEGIEITEKEEEMTHKEEEMTHMEEEMTHKEEDMTHKEEEMTHKEEEMTHKEEDMTHKEEEMTHKEEEMTHKEEEMTHKEEEMTRKEEEMTHKEEEMTRKEEEMTHKEEEMTRKEEEMTHKEEEMTHKEEEMTSKEGEKE